MIRAYPSLDANLERIVPLLSTRSLERGHRRISFLLDDRSRARLIALIEFEAMKFTYMCIYIYFLISFLWKFVRFHFSKFFLF